MSNFDWLDKIVKARTPGPWTECEGTNLVFKDYQYHDLPSMIASVQYENDRHFTAAMGTLADKIMDVVKAASSVNDANQGALPWFPQFDADLDDALDALQAAKDEV